MSSIASPNDSPDGGGRRRLSTGSLPSESRQPPVPPPPPSAAAAGLPPPFAQRPQSAEPPLVARPLTEAPPLQSSAVRGRPPAANDAGPPPAAGGQALRQRWRDAVTASVGETVPADPGPDEQSFHPARRWEVPPWLVSAIVHLSLLMLLALIAAHPASRLGDLIVSLGQPESAGELEQFELSDLPATADMAAQAQMQSDAPVSLQPNLQSESVSLDTPIPLELGRGPEVGGFFGGRSAALRGAMLAMYGGTRATEDAVANGLKWLSRQQLKNGSWSMMKPYTSGAVNENQPAATAMALLAFQGAGNTHLDGEYKEVVAAGWDWLLKQQDLEGNFITAPVPSSQQLYAQAQCTIALCEIYAMTGESRFLAPAQRALRYAESIQAKEGGWRYTPGFDSDLSVTGWFAMAIQSGRSAGLEVSDDTMLRVNYFLDSLQDETGAYYRYQALRPLSAPMTAEGLLCRMFLGWKPEDPRLETGATSLLIDHPVDAEKMNVYYWYYATQVLHHMGGSLWSRWNEKMREVIPALQAKNGRDAGSWGPEQDYWGSSAGRLYTTCLSIYCLEVYYRHMPLYGSPSKESR
jgi:hypothetical protein